MYSMTDFSAQAAAEAASQNLSLGRALHTCPNQQRVYQGAACITSTMYS